MFARIMLLAPPWSALTYSLPASFPASFWRPGLRIAVPLGKTALRVGVLLETMPVSGLDSDALCREIIWPLEARPLISGELLDLAEELALRQGCAPGYILGHVLPRGLRSVSVKIRYWEAGRAQMLGLRKVAALGENTRASLGRDFAAGKAFVVPEAQGSAEMELCQLQIDPPWPLRPAAHRQREILDYLYENGPVSRRILLRAIAAASSPLQALIKAGHVCIKQTEPEELASDGLLAPPEGDIQLNAEQRAAFEDMRSMLKSGKAASRLLYGVTSSGKTAVYLELARECLAAGKSMLLLAPEVALACKLARDVAAGLPNAPRHLYHGYQSAPKRERIFRELGSSSTPCVVIGTRSALFLPLSGLGCIILDEEHDGSFKQDENLGYHAKEVAWFRAKKADGLLVLGSATPDIKTFHAARAGNLPMLRLSQRVGGRKMPPIELVDIGARPGLATYGSLAAMAEGQGLLGESSEQALRDCMQKGEQAVIMLNRRGYAPMIYCTDCGKILRCPHCEIGLAFHKGQGRLVCHYCGYSAPYPSPCPQCGKMNYLAVGEGTERLAERLEIMTGRPVLRLDRDSTRRPGRVEEILGAFARGESPFLVGTQMLSKGHHFPNVTLVIVADGDIGLNLPDYRAAERTFQLLVQSAGRAGRGCREGRVLIQTRDMQHYCWNYVTSYDYEGFYEEELARRKRSLYPPFIKLAILRVSFDLAETSAPAALGELTAVLRPLAKELDIKLLGPAPAPLAILRSRKRFQFLLKGREWNSLRQIYFVAERTVRGSGLRLFLDLDPVNML